MLSRAVKQGYATVAKHLNHFGSFLTKYARSLIPKESNSAHTHGPWAYVLKAFQMILTYSQGCEPPFQGFGSPNIWACDR